MHAYVRIHMYVFMHLCMYLTCNLRNLVGYFWVYAWICAYTYVCITDPTGTLFKTLAAEHAQVCARDIDRHRYRHRYR
jgi:hypothetical protein